MSEITVSELQAADFSPKLLKFSLFDGLHRPEGYRYGLRNVYDYELTYIIESRGGQAIIDGHRYPVCTGDIFFKKPGQTMEAIAPYKSYLLIFDVKGDTKKNPACYSFYQETVYQCLYHNPILDAIPLVYRPSDNSKYLALFKSIFSSFLDRSEGASLLLKSKILQLLYEIYTDASSSWITGEIPRSAHYACIKRVTEHIQAHFGSKMSLDMLAEISGLSPCYFHKIFKKAMQITPNEYITRVRLDKARELLAKTNAPVYEIAIRCGFDNVPYFSYLFYKHLSITPREFRHRHR